MAFFISDKLGIAYESCEGGLAKWSSEDKDFTRSMSRAESREAIFAPAKRVTEDEARAFMLSKAAASGASGPRA